MSSPSPVPATAQQHRPAAAYGAKPVEAATPAAYIKPQHAHPSAYYFFDMLFKLIMSAALIGIVAILAIGVADMKKHNSDAADKLGSIRNYLGSLSNSMSSISGSIGDISRILQRT